MALTSRAFGRLRRTCKVFKHLCYSHRCFSFEARFLTPSEAAAALRPFYFVVHPDLFVRYPQIRLVNEQSLKLLQEHLVELYRNPGYGSNYSNQPPLMLSFYLRDVHKVPSGGKFRMVNLSLQRDSLYRTVLEILQKSSLPTDCISKLDMTATVHAAGQLPSDWTDYDQEQLRMFWARKSDQSAFRGPTLQESVEKLHSEAQLSKETHLAVWADLERFTSSNSKPVQLMCFGTVNGHWPIAEALFWLSPKCLEVTVPLWHASNCTQPLWSAKLFVLATREHF